MNILLKSAKIIDPTSSFHSKTLDIHIRKGIIDNISKNISAPKATIISHQNLYVSPGWFDSSVSSDEIINQDPINKNQIENSSENI